jgi:hypothetical protein
MFLQRKKLELADLYCAGGASPPAFVVRAGASGGEEPFTNFGANAVEKLFAQGEITDLMMMVKKLAV